jgi:hypothetical protein
LRSSIDKEVEQCRLEPIWAASIPSRILADEVWESGFSAKGVGAVAEIMDDLQEALLAGGAG